MDRVRHKAANRFKFIPFSERISNVNIDVFHRVPHRFEEESAEKFTYFYLAVQKWTVLNLTEKWKAFRKEIGDGIETLPQLLNNKENIMDVFMRNMRLQNELSLQPVLELIVALVKDLRYEFYPFYPQVLKELIQLLKYKDPDVLEATFTCLAYIFKYLSRELVKDLDKVLLDLAPLFNDNNPEYVRDFAAQSFSFVARKVKDKNKFLSLVLYAVQSSPLVSVGCGQLIFEMMKGIRGQTHSCAEELFLVLFNSLGKSEIPQKTLFALTSQVVEAYGTNISPQYSILFKVLVDVLKYKAENEDIKGLKKLLKITRIGLNCKGGAHASEATLPQLVTILVKLLSLNVEVQKLAVGICSDMLKLRNLKLQQEFGSRLITKVMQTNETEILLQFVEETSNSAGFEASILPRALQNFSSLDSPEFLKVLTKIVVDKTTEPVKTLDKVDNYPLTLTPSTMRIFTFITDTLKRLDEKCDDVTSVLCCLILVRHLERIESTSVIPLVSDIVKKCVNWLRTSSEGKQRNLFVLCVALESLLQFKKEFTSSEEIDGVTLCEVMLKILQSDKSILALRSFDLFLTLCDDFTCSENLFNDLYTTIQDWLLSPQSNSRLLALHVLQKLEESRLNKASNEMVNVLQTALDAELVPLTITDYRDKIKLLDKLNFERLGSLQDEQHQVLVKYLLGALYCNFKLLWDPISQLISSYSIGMPINSFWDVFFSQLRTATANCKGMASSQDYNLPEFDDYLLNSVKFIKAEDKPDHCNYRYLLWNTMTLFPDLCETKNRDVISVYLPFVEDEILKSSSEHSLVISIQQNDPPDLNGSRAKLDESLAEDGKSKNVFPSVIKCGVAQLTLLSKFKNPKQCYREPDVRNSYLELLLHKDLEIQKMALECLLTYKFSYLTPYKQNLRNLIDDGKFKDDLVHFQIDTETGVVKDIHREDLMPLVMRILYSKMLFRSSTPRGNKGSASLLRRSIILRFLAGSSHSEMEVFLKMAFKFCNSYCEDDVLQYEKIMNAVDLEKVPPPKKLQNIVNLADVVLNHFGGLMSVHLQRYVLKVLLSVGSFVSGIFSMRDQIHSGYLPSLRNLRTTCIDSVTKFFDKFQKFPWREDDVNALFYVLVWPNLSKLPVESVHNPTALLRLFLAWSKNPRYFKLLARYDQRDESNTPLPFIMQLLLNEKSQSSVTACITSILENLLTLREEEPMEVDDEEPPVPLNVDFVLPVDESAIERLHLNEELNYGSKILFPHVGSILAFLRRTLEKSDASGFGKSQVTVLSRITEMATSPEHGDALMKLLIKLLSSTKQPEDDALVNMITTVENLTNIVPNPESYLRSIAVLFGTIELTQARKILVNLVVNMDRRRPELTKIVNVVRDLNAWDWRWVDQPNFDKRLDAFKKIRTLLEDEDFNIDLAFIVLHDCFFFVRCETDLSLRDSASFCVKEICPKIANILKHKISVRQQWIESILTLTKRGIVSENESYQTLSIALLGVMARECPEYHPVLRDLSVLTNKQDPEVDFFENAQHLQIYRRLKALQKFSSIAKTLKKAPTPRTLTQFVLPLASRYLCSAKYSGKNSLIDSAIEAVATVCKFLPWQQYQMVLRFYLTKLRKKIEFQKQLTRTVIAILDSFHFDISRAVPTPEEETSVLMTASGSGVIQSVKRNEKEDLPISSSLMGGLPMILLKKGMMLGTPCCRISLHTTEQNRISDVSRVCTKRELYCVIFSSLDKRASDTQILNLGAKNAEIKEETAKTSKETEVVREEKMEIGEEEENQNDKKEVAEKEDVPEELAEVFEAQESLDQEESNEEDGKEFAIESITKLNPNAALKVEKAISGSLLDQLYKVIGEKSQIEGTHKLNYKNLGPDKDEEDILKIPIAVTLVKLLQKLPERMLERQLPGIFMRLCTFLKSRMESVRRVTRETLQQILFSLGPKYLSLLFSEMSASLKKGFQVHVLVYTMHSVIQHVHSLLQPGDIDANLPVLLEACKSDLFGALSEEKDVAQIQAQHKEAKATKSYHLIHLIAQCLTEKCLTDLILPVKEVLQTSYSHKNITKCREYLRQVTLGLSSNQFISNENLYIYVYGTTSESIPQLLPTPPEPPKKKNPKEKQDCFIIPPEPKTRMGVSSNPVKKGSRSNVHIIIEFGLYLLHTLLKKDKVKNADRDLRCYLDPIAPILINALESQHVRVSTLALQCLSKVIKYDLPNIKAGAKKITDCLFSILHKYAAAGLCKGDNFDLVMAAFKAISTLIRETDYHGITAEQLKILLLYTEQDIYDTSRQASAFTLLKTILRKKLNSPELHELMQKVAALSVTSELPHIRLQARQNVFQYMMDYPLKSKLEEFIGFFLSQLNFDVESGRLSSLEMIQSLINAFPSHTLEEQSGVFLMTLGASLVNDDSANCKKMISGILKGMLTRVSASQRNQLFDILMMWFQHKKIVHRRLAAQISGIFVTVEKEEFKARLPVILPIIQKQFVGDYQPGQFVRIPKNEAEEDKMKDHHFFQVLQLLLKICSNYPEFLTSKEHQENISLFCEITQSLLCHAHEWVRLAAAQFLGYVFNSCQPSDVAAVLIGRPVETELSFLEPATIQKRVRSLILDHCAQFIPGVEIGQEFVDQLTRNLVYFARVLKSVKGKEEEEEEDEDEENEEGSGQPPMTLLWLTKRMRRIVNMELGQCPTSNVLRSAVLKWIGAVAMCSSKAELKSVLYHLMAPVVREREIMEGENGQSPMKTLVMEICGMLKKKVGVEDYSREAVKIRGKLMEKRVQRRSQRAQEFIVNPERAAKRKIERQAKKKETRKRKIEKMKGNRFKRRKRNDDDGF